MDADFARMLSELKKRASEANFHVLSFIIGMAELEAEETKLRKRPS